MWTLPLSVMELIDACMEDAAEEQPTFLGAGVYGGSKELMQRSFWTVAMQPV
jgi:hypothetical protein